MCLENHLCDVARQVFNLNPEVTDAHDLAALAHDAARKHNRADDDIDNLYDILVHHAEEHLKLSEVVRWRRCWRTRQELRKAKHRPLFPPRRKGGQGEGPPPRPVSIIDLSAHR